MFFTPLSAENLVNETGYRLPPSVLPAVSEQRSVLHRSTTLAVAVHRFEISTIDFTFALRVEGFGLDESMFHCAFDPHKRHRLSSKEGREGFDQLSGTFRVGLEFSDGAVSENHVNSGPGGPVIRTTGSSSSTRNGHGECSNGVRVPELPPPGDFKVYVAWPNAGLDECSATFDADELLAKADEAIPLFPEK